MRAFAPSESHESHANEDDGSNLLGSNADGVAGNLDGVAKQLYEHMLSDKPTMKDLADAIV